ncbi:hypothetical protein KTT66_03675 [Lacticaseibacillus casei]|jgi:hypothetical protein|uniref:Peptidase M50B-like protein n=1 Tax=Lacticaseibacillus huelsenbergensis TaxID=3035291 RepID=A0ABY8DNN8_9LACO|nr:MULTISPECIES: hypothetical protein [Lacticaseibacillus]MDG3061780.1 hypothetical protein [Lacticaseibacillus sp. BCRC 81376]QVI38122.1 hypothetical protein KGS74_03840 [Lacticaseibacillus casei]QXG59936.1 hypothetical protein KTT66_03675 [Lacticaseibacillus casei]WFB38590.1 hypothetical protein LHUE1_002126 [Lacticaseibacillus huelsenbergensis]WFB43015.1 hypothetical protein LHUE2_001076 [Lacticaseibacillus huelsenbergensis]
MQAFMNVYVPGWLIFIGGILLISVVNGATVQAMVNHAGRSNTQIWYMKPGIFVHELLHAAIARVFGLQVTNFSLRADPLQGSAAHVSLRYDRHDPLAQLGLFLSSSAPVWGISIVLLVLGRWAFFPAGNQVWQVLAASSSLSEKWVMMRGMVAINWQWLAIFLVVTLILTPGVALSHRDLQNMWQSAPVAFLGTMVIFYLFLTFWPAGFSWWTLLNLNLLLLDLMVLGFSLVIWFVVNLL